MRLLLGARAPPSPGAPCAPTRWASMLLLVPTAAAGVEADSIRTLLGDDEHQTGLHDGTWWLW